MIRNLQTKVVRKFKRSTRKKKYGTTRFSGRTSGKRSTRFSFPLRKLLTVVILIASVASIVGWGVLTFHRIVTFNPDRAYRDEAFEIEREWKGEDRLTILFVGLDRRDDEFAFVDSLVVTVVDPTDQSVGIFNLNVDAAQYNYEFEQVLSLRNVYNTAVLKKDTTPVRAVMRSVERLLSIKMNRYILVDEDGLPEVIDSLGGVYVQNPGDVLDEDITTAKGAFSLQKGSYRLGGEEFLYFFQTDDGGHDAKLSRHVEAMQGFFNRATSYTIAFRFPSFLNAVEGSVQTDMSEWELIRFGSQLIMSDEIRTSFTKKASFMGNSQPITEELDEDIKNVFADQRIGKEQARVEVFNATNIQGLASFRARWLRNIGIDVIRVGDTSRPFEKTTVFVTNGETYDYTIKGVQKLFEEDIDVVQDTPSFVTTGDVIIVLGDNIGD